MIAISCFKGAGCTSDFGSSRKKKLLFMGEMCLGEGQRSGYTFFRSLDMGIAVYDSMSTFEDIHVEQYEELV